jgi:hypothetical protein
MRKLFWSMPRERCGSVEQFGGPALRVGAVATDQVTAIGLATHSKRPPGCGLDRHPEHLRPAAGEHVTAQLWPALQPQRKRLCRLQLHRAVPQLAGLRAVASCRAGASTGSNSRERSCTSQAAITTQSPFWLRRPPPAPGATPPPVGQAARSARYQPDRLFARAPGSAGGSPPARPVPARCPRESAAPRSQVQHAGGTFAHQSGAPDIIVRPQRRRRGG